jgi:hypothetical protein
MIDKMLNVTNRYKSQYEILYILVYTKKTKSDILYIVNSTHFNTI